MSSSLFASRSIFQKVNVSVCKVFILCASRIQTTKCFRDLRALLILSLSVHACVPLNVKFRVGHTRSQSPSSIRTTIDAHCDFGVIFSVFEHVCASVCVLCGFVLLVPLVSLTLITRCSRILNSVVFRFAIWPFAKRDSMQSSADDLTAIPLFRGRASFVSLPLNKYACNLSARRPIRRFVVREGDEFTAPIRQPLCGRNVHIHTHTRSPSCICAVMSACFSSFFLLTKHEPRSMWSK